MATFRERSDRVEAGEVKGNLCANSSAAPSFVYFHLGRPSGPYSNVSWEVHGRPGENQSDCPEGISKRKGSLIAARGALSMKRKQC